jgi:hypothetical protein
MWNASPYYAYEYFETFPPSNSDRRDSFKAFGGGAKGYKIAKCTRPNLPNAWRDNYLTLTFTMEYRRSSSLTRKSPFIREIDYVASAYTVNPNWPTNNNGIVEMPEDED